MATEAGENTPPQPIAGQLQLLRARSGVAVTLRKGQTIQIINTYGSQVVDTWAFDSGEPSIRMSMQHTRASLQKISIAAGDTLLSNRRSPILTIDADTTPGVHDTLIAACDKYRYEQLGAIGYHPSCADNFSTAIKQAGLAVDSVPSPLNLFMNVPVMADGSLRFKSPVSTPGQSVTLRADVDLILILSACPQDMIAVNGTTGCTDVHFVVI